MCGKCRMEEYSLEDLRKGGGDEDRPTCDWYDEEEAEQMEEDGTLEFCGKPAVAIVHEKMAEDHLCGAHVEQEKAGRSEGLEEFMHFTGLEEACEFLPIDPGEICDECPRPATHVKVSTVPTALCRQHAKPYRKGAG